MSKFTKGKWIIDRDGSAIFSDSEDCYVAELSPANSDEQVAANARLIAAAPERYAIIYQFAGFESCPHEAWPDQEYLLRDLCRRSSHVLTRIDGKEAHS